MGNIEGQSPTTSIVLVANGGIPRQTIDLLTKETNFRGYLMHKVPAIGKISGLGGICLIVDAEKYLIPGNETCKSDFGEELQKPLLAQEFLSSWTDIQKFPLRIGVATVPQDNVCYLRSLEGMAVNGEPIFHEIASPYYGGIVPAIKAEYLKELFDAIQRPS